jgi:hypothetical protein
VEPEAVQRLLKAIGMATVAAIAGGIGTALAYRAIDDGSVLYGFFAALTLGLALVAVLGAVIAAGGRTST